VASEADKYSLSVSEYSGDAGDALNAPFYPTRIADGMQFSTPDQDNDLCTCHCSAANGGGWWHNRCARSYLNRDENSVWHTVDDTNNLDVVFSRMLIKLD